MGFVFHECTILSCTVRVKVNCGKNLYRTKIGREASGMGGRLAKEGSRSRLAAERFGRRDSKDAESPGTATVRPGNAVI